ncbi:MAG: hypothetical protein QOD93_2389 [Acetobacteraceae bacterium]|nr:hypothetical protein [Acetobacteraceae bacterium]
MTQIPTEAELFLGTAPEQVLAAESQAHPPRRLSRKLRLRRPSQTEKSHYLYVKRGPAPCRTGS